MFKYFVGVKNEQELRTRYKELAKKHHPDRGGITAVFQELKHEYESISNSSYPFPISNNQFTTAYYNGAKDFADVMSKYAYAERKAKEANRNIWDEIRKSRPLTEEELWSQAKETDDNLKIIDDLIDICIDEHKTGNWFVCEMFKLGDLSLKHFKYARFKLKKHTPSGMQLTDDWISTCYQNYVSIQQINWKTTQ